jgi:Major Facilitator Superfamily
VLLGVGWGANQTTPMLLVYHQVLGLGTGTLEAAFGVYALGLIPGLLIAGPLSDVRGRRAVVVPAAVASLVASVLLIGSGYSVALLFAGRLLAGVSSGAAFGAGTAWLREASRPPLGTASDHTAAQRAAIAMTTGFATGPLVAGLLAQWAPAPTVVPYLPHVAVMAVVLVLLRGAPETVVAGPRTSGPRPTAPGPGLTPPGLPPTTSGRRLTASRLRLTVPGPADGRFRTAVAPMAPWVFVAPAVAFALLPSVVGAEHATDGIALTATIAALCALAGVLIQPLARRLDAGGRSRAATTGLLVLTGGLVLAAVTAHADRAWLLVPCAIVLGSAYGLCLVAGLVEIQRLADPRSLAGLTAAYYALAYLGFAAPYLIVLATHLASYALVLAAVAALALGTAGLINRPAARMAAQAAAAGNEPEPSR